MIKQLNQLGTECNENTGEEKSFVQSVRLFGDAWALAFRRCACRLAFWFFFWRGHNYYATNESMDGCGCEKTVTNSRKRVASVCARQKRATRWAARTQI